MRASTVEELGLQRRPQQFRVGVGVPAERDNARNASRLGGGFEPRVLTVVAVENGGAARLDPGKDFRLGVGDFFERAKIFQMHRLDGGDDGDVRTHQFGERRDLAGMVHADFEHRVFRGLRTAGER